MNNWAGNYQYSAVRRHAPKTVAEVQDLVRNANKVKALGRRHSFNGVADTTEDQISMEHFDRIVAWDRERNTVTVEGGITYGQLCPELHRQGYALHNLASLPHIAVAGACATATHGSGVGNGNLATAVSALELVTADGEVKQLSRERDGETFLGAVVGLGGLGVVTKLTLDLAPTYHVCQEVYENLPLAQLESHFEEIMAHAYSVSLFTDWSGTDFNQVWFKRRESGVHHDILRLRLFGATYADVRLHPIPGLSADPCTEQMGIPGHWYERLTHFRIDHTPSAGEELQAEYFVPRQHAVAAIKAVGELREKIVPLVQVSEVRTIAADNLWMSPCYQQDSVAIHFTWFRDEPAVTALLGEIEAKLAPFHARPHWGKLFTLPHAQLEALYPKLPDFRNLLQTFDPAGKFRNAYLDRHIFGVG
ncbi:MAG TPA: D-arabinono-1,4-lactone oxidase [Chthonomonadaceae bacterium]|nr:D-arabinono-1,4-lactone oxidase [Chthonomonadaceae bacterium]